MATMLRSCWLNLKRDYVALALTFILPVVFFSIFASVFSGMGGGGGTSDVEIAVVDEDDSDVSRRLVAALQKDASLDVRLGPGKSPESRYDRASAEQAIRDGDVYVAVIFPKGFGESFGGFAAGGIAVDLIADPVADPISHQMVAGLLQGAAMSAAPDLMIERGLDQFDQFVGMTDAQKTTMDQWLATLKSDDGDDGDDGDAGSAAAGFGGMIPVNTIDISLRGEEDDTAGRIVAFYAAAIGVMFLLFSMTGAMGMLLEEQRSGTLERVLNSNIGMGRLLTSYWLFAAIVGFLQITVMFVWGWAVFGMELWTGRIVVGFVVMTAVSAAAASGFGLVLGTACRSEGQLRGISTIVILVMSAIGGSMFPRFLMPEGMQKLGLATFNGWAIDGYQKIFHHGQTVFTLWPQVLVLVGMTVVFLGIARLLARRWEAV